MIAALVLICASPALRAADIAYDDIRATKRVVAVRTTERIVVDGVLDEDAWKQAEPAADFYQQQPDEGKSASMPSEVRFLYDDRNLYIGGTFYDPDPVHGPITNELKRDFSARDGDLITIVLDTFGDRRNAFGFMTNPAGAIRDSQNYDDGRQNNQNWDGVWFVRTARFAGGWTMEVAIPFTTLRFRPGAQQQWGLQLMRLIRRINEVDMWSPVPRQFTQFKTSYAGVLTGISGVRPGRSLYVKPFVTSQLSSSSGGATARHADGGLDMKLGVGRSLTFDASYRTDFSQVEVDQQQVNLTRFALFYPEKREFFLENQGAFRIGDQDSSAQGSSSSGSAAATSQRRDLVPFFSRRIGLSSAGDGLPVFGGLRLSGKSGAYTLGLLEMRTENSAAAPATAYTTLRVSRDIGRGSSIGGFYLGSESIARSDRVIGADVHLNFRRTNDLDAFFMKSRSPDAQGGTWAGRAAFSSRHDLYTTQLSYTNIEPGFRNDLGFIPRPNVALATAEYQRNFRPEKTYRWIRTYTVGAEGDFFLTPTHDRLLTRTLRHDYALEFPDGGIFTADVLWNHEVLTQPYAVASGVVLQPGTYDYRQFVPSYSSSKAKWLSGSVKLTMGEFWSGHITGADTGVRVRVDEHLAISATYTPSRVTLPVGSFDATLAGFRIDHSFSTRMFLNAFIQHNSVTRTWLSNIRYDLIHRPLSDLFVVYNDANALMTGHARSLSIKYTHLIAF